MADRQQQSPIGVGEPQPPSAAAIMITRRCNMTCEHCSVESGPKIRGEPSVSELIARIHDLADAGISAVQITGGEPMIREKVVFDLLRVIRQRRMGATLSTNGFWGRTHASAWRTVGALKRAGLLRVTLSYDRYHAEFQGPGPGLNIARAAEWFDLPLNVNITRVADDPELAGLIAPFEKRHQLKMRFYDVQVVGRARELPVAGMRGEVSGFCNAACAPAITDDGRMTACNGPAYFLGSESPLAIGSLHESPMSELIDRHTNDPILETIRRAGPERLLRELEDAGVARQLGIRRQHAGICDLCIDINSKPEAVSVLRERLAAPRHQAELAARRMVVLTSAAERTSGIEWANGIGSARLWLDGAAGRFDRFDAGAEKILGRADFDWTHSAEYLEQCGLARPLAVVMERHALRRWAPSFFVERLKPAGIRQGIRELAQTDVIRRLDEALFELATRGVLLKGGAVLAIDEFGDGKQGAIPRRGAGDIDVVVPASDANRLREHLLASGFHGSRDALRTGPHHLAPVSLNGVAIEIHTAIMPSFWGLPEKEMLERVRPVSGLRSLSTLDEEGMILHAMTHASAHVFSHGIRAGWDTAWLLERFGSLDVERLRAWINRMAMPRAFWVPARVLSRGMVSLPQQLMQHAPRDERQRRLERIAELRLFSVAEGAFDLNPISKNGFFLLLHDSSFGRARHIASLFGRSERESRRSAAAASRQRYASANRSALTIQLQEGLMHWRRFRRAINA